MHIVVRGPIEDEQPAFETVHQRKRTGGIVGSSTVARQSKVALSVNGVVIAKIHDAGGGTGRLKNIGMPQQAHNGGKPSI